MRRRCIRDDEWEENNGCYREEAKMLFILVISHSLAEPTSVNVIHVGHGSYFTYKCVISE